MDYNPEGAMGGMFAPAYIAGYQPSMDAVAAWQAANRSMTPEMVEETRMPAAWQAPSSSSSTADALGLKAAGMPGATSGGGGSYGDPRGNVDPEALRILAQGGH